MLKMWSRFTWTVPNNYKQLSLGQIHIRQYVSNLKLKMSFTMEEYFLNF